MIFLSVSLSSGALGFNFLLLVTSFLKRPMLLEQLFVATLHALFMECATWPWLLRVLASAMTSIKHELFSNVTIVFTLDSIVVLSVPTRADFASVRSVCTRKP